MIRIILLTATLCFAAGCNLNDSKTPDPDPVVSDTLAAFGPPVALSAEQYTGTSDLGARLNMIKVSWRRVQGAVGYLVYYSDSTVSGPYSKVYDGKTHLDTFSKIVYRDGIYFAGSNTLFFKVSAIDGNGVESAMGAHTTIVYDGW